MEIALMGLYRIPPKNSGFMGVFRLGLKLGFQVECSRFVMGSRVSGLG